MGVREGSVRGQRRFGGGSGKVLWMNFVASFVGNYSMDKTDLLASCVEVWAEIVGKFPYDMRTMSR